MTTGPALGFAGLCARTLFSGRKAWAAAFLAGLPPLVAAATVGIGGARVDGTELFQGIAFFFSLRVMILLQALIFGMALTSGEIEEGTVGYIYLGLLPRWAVVLIQVAVASAALTLLAGASLLLTGCAAALAGTNPLAAFGRSVGSAALLGGIGTLVSLSFYVTCGLAFRRPLVVGLVATFFWEIVVPVLPMKFAAYTLTSNLRSLMLTLLFDGRKNRWYGYTRFQDFPAYGEAALFLSLLAGLFLVTAMVAAMNRSVEGRESH